MALWYKLKSNFNQWSDLDPKYGKDQIRTKNVSWNILFIEWFYSFSSNGNYIETFLKIYNVNFPMCMVWWYLALVYHGVLLDLPSIGAVCSVVERRVDNNCMANLLLKPTLKSQKNLQLPSCHSCWYYCCSYLSVWLWNLFYGGSWKPRFLNKNQQIKNE